MDRVTILMELKKRMWMNEGPLGQGVKHRGTMGLEGPHQGVFGVLPPDILRKGIYKSVHFDS
jgi:hypothetical protein